MSKAKRKQPVKIASNKQSAPMGMHMGSPAAMKKAMLKGKRRKGAK